MKTVFSTNSFLTQGFPLPNTFLKSTRYGFNGKLKDNEIEGEGDVYDYGMRMLDVRLGRFLRVDPLERSFPMLTPYQYASNSPISGIDLDGLEKVIYLINFSAEKVTRTKIELAK